jgi:hypothetical protein
VIGFVLLAALHIGPFATAVATPTPIPTATPTAVPTVPPATPTVPPATHTLAPASTPPLSGGDLHLQALLNHVPSDIRSTCVDSTATTDILASVDCTADSDAIAVSYTLYPDMASMDAAFDGFKEGMGSDATAGSCSDTTAWPKSDTYTVSDVHAGRYLCVFLGEEPNFMWTDERINVFSWAWHNNNDAARLYDFWLNDAGPNE